VPSRGFTVFGDHTVFLDADRPLSKIDEKFLEKLYPGR
jgi:hypothetical protein